MLKPSCEPCRAKKLHCDGALPRCSTCIQSPDSIQSAPCTYDPPDRDKKASRLKEACLSCRRRKKRCDGFKPKCTRCRRSRTEEECIYEKHYSDRRSRHRDSKDPFEIKISPRHLVTLPVSQPNVPGRSIDVLPPLSTDLVPVAADRGARSSASRIDTFYLNPFLSFPQISSLSFKQSIAPFPVPLSTTYDSTNDPYSFALTDVSLADLNMKFRIIFLSRRLDLGLQLSPAKQKAVLMGDMSNSVIHSFFIHFAHLTGCQKYQELQGQFNLLYIQSVHLRLVLDTLTSMVEEDDPLTLMTAYQLIAMVHGYVQNVRYAKYYFKKTMDIYQKYNIRFVPTSVAAQKAKNIVCQPPLSDDVRERVAFLAHMLYATTFAYLSGKADGIEAGFDPNLGFELPKLYCGIYAADPEPISSDLERQFRYELPDAYPTIFEICPVVLRTRSIILNKDANNIIAWYHQQPIPSPTWFTTCRIFLFQLTSHIDSLTTRISESTDIEDGRRWTVLQFSNILSLTTMAQVYHVLGRCPSSSSSEEFDPAECRKKRNNVLRRLLAIVDEIEPEVFRFLDPFLGICWSRAIKILSHCSGSPAITNLPNSNTTPPPSQPPSSPPPSSSTDQNQQPLSSPPADDDEDSDFEGSLSRLSGLNNNFIENRFMPGMTTLCAKLAAFGDGRTGKRSSPSSGDGVSSVLLESGGRGTD